MGESCPTLSFCRADCVIAMKWGIFHKPISSWIALSDVVKIHLCFKNQWRDAHWGWWNRSHSWNEGGLSHKSVYHLCSCWGSWKGQTVILCICKEMEKIHVTKTEKNHNWVTTASLLCKFQNINICHLSSHHSIIFPHLSLPSAIWPLETT